MWFVVVFNLFCFAVLFFCLLEASCFLSFWFILELLSLSVIPHFFFGSSLSSHRSLFQYIIISSFSSFCLLLGVLVFQLHGIFLLVGVLIKLGVFPFLGWAYEVVVYSSWKVIWLFSGLLKISFVLLMYIFGYDLFDLLLSVLSFFCFSVLSYNFWKFSESWRHCWCHMMLSGSVCLVVISLYCSSVSVFLVYFVYFIWSSLVLVFLSLVSKGGVSKGGFWVFVYVSLLLSFPCSLAMFYKLSLSLAMLSVSFLVLGAWCIYSIFEQLFVLFFFIGRNCMCDSPRLLSLI